MLRLLRLKSSSRDIRSLNLLRAALAELLGAFLLVFIGVASCIENDDNTDSKVIRIALTFGFSVFVIVWSIAHVSGGHINPGVTVGMLVGRRISLIRAIVYVAAQITGAIFAAWLLKALVFKADEFRVNLPKQDANRVVYVGNALVIEAIITGVLVFTVFAACDKRRVGFEGFGPLAIGFSIALCHLGFIPLTGASMNSARSFGPALVFGRLRDNWLYWVGPLLGGAVGALLYDLLFAGDACWTKFYKWLISAEFDPDHYDDCVNCTVTQQTVTTKETTETFHLS